MQVVVLSMPEFYTIAILAGIGVAYAVADLMLWLLKHGYIKD